MSVVDGLRSVAYIGSAKELKQNYDLIQNSNVEVIVVKKDDGTSGNIVYTDLERAKALKGILDKHGGYLMHKTPEDAIENGEILEYADEDIKTFVDGKFGQGMYDKIKMKY